MASHEKDPIAILQGMFGASTNVYSDHTQELHVTEELSPVTLPIQDIPDYRPAFEETPQAAAIYAPHSANISTPTVDIKPGKHPLLPGVSSYVVVTDEKGNRKIRDYDRGKYSFLEELMTAVPAAEIGMTTPTKPPILAQQTTKYVAPIEVPLQDIVFQESVTTKNGKQKKTMSEKWHTFERNASRTAKVVKTAGVLAVAGMALSTGYKAGGGPSVFENGILSAPKNISLDLQMAIQNPWSTFIAQPRRLTGKSN